MIYISEVINVNLDKMAKNLTAIRGRKTREEMAIELGVTPSAVGMYERGERVPRDETKLKYAKLAGRSIDEIFFTTNDTKCVWKDE